MDDVKHICWSDVINEELPDAALDEFMKLLLPIIDKHAPVNFLWHRGRLRPTWPKARENAARQIQIK